MALKRSDEEVWHWHQHLQQFKASGMTPAMYCRTHKLNDKTFSNLKFRMEYIKDSNPELYAHWVPITRQYMASAQSAAEFAKEHKIPINKLCEMGTHLAYVDVVERLKLEKEDASMQFIQVPNPRAIRSESAAQNPYPDRLPAESAQSAEPEVIQPQNDLEIIISKGVKVSISPNIDTMKIIKIIELLKDL